MEEDQVFYLEKSTNSQFKRSIELIHIGTYRFT